MGCAGGGTWCCLFPFYTSYLKTPVCKPQVDLGPWLLSIATTQPAVLLAAGRVSSRRSWVWGNLLGFSNFLFLIRLFLNIPLENKQHN